MATKNCLSEKDKIKFNLQEKKTIAKLNAKTVEENKKHNIRKSLKINTQMIPNLDSPSKNIKTTTYKNIISTIKSQIEAASDLPYSLSPKPITKQRNDKNYCLGLFSPIKNIKEKQGALYKPVIKLNNCNQNKLKSNSVLKKLSINLDDSNTSRNLGLNHNFNLDTLLKSPNTAKSTVNNSNKRNANKSISNNTKDMLDISNLKAHISTQSKIINNPKTTTHKQSISISTSTDISNIQNRLNSSNAIPSPFKSQGSQGSNNNYSVEFELSKSFFRNNLNDLTVNDSADNKINDDTYFNESKEDLDLTVIVNKQSMNAKKSPSKKIRFSLHAGAEVLILKMMEN